MISLSCSDPSLVHLFQRAKESYSGSELNSLAGKTLCWKVESFLWRPTIKLNSTSGGWRIPMDESPDGTLRFKHSFNIQHIPGKVNSTADFLSRCSNKSVCVCVYGGDCWLVSLHSPTSFAQLYSVIHSISFYGYSYTHTLSVYSAQVYPTAQHILS